MLPATPAGPGLVRLRRSRGGDAGRNHYRIAAGSAAEACAALELVGTSEALALQPKLRRVGAMLRGLAR